MHVRHRPAAGGGTRKNNPGTDTQRHLALCLVARWIVVQLIAGAPCPEAGPPFEALWRLVVGFRPTGQRVDVAIAVDVIERAYYAARHDGGASFLPAAIAHYHELRRRYPRLM